MCLLNRGGSTIKGKLHVRGADNTDWPPAGDTFAEANLSLKQTVTKFLFFFQYDYSLDYTVSLGAFLMQ